MTKKIEEIIDNDSIDKLIQKKLNVEQIIDDNDKYVTITPGEGFWPLGLFHDTHCEKYNFLTLFLGHARPSLTCSYQKIVQAKLTNTNRKFAYHLQTYFFNHQSFNSFYIIGSYLESKIIGSGTYN